MTVGNFDGVHRGHRAVIAHLCGIAHSRNLSPVLVTFSPHHRIYFRPDAEPFLLTDLEEKIEFLNETDLDHAVILPFDKSLSTLTAEEFVQEIIMAKLGAEVLLVGHDQAMGSDQVKGIDEFRGLGDILGLDIETTPPVGKDDHVISSTSIRYAVGEGRVSDVAEAQGFPYILSGTVVHGDKRGRTLGYPTANLRPADPHKLIPADGIYVVRVHSDHVQADGLLYIGTRPTLFKGATRTIEVFLLDRNDDLYDSSLHVHLLKRLRGDMKFSSEAALIAQISEDERQARQFLAAGKTIAVDVNPTTT